MGSHVVRTRIQRPDGRILEPGDTIDHDGPHTWKLIPLDEKLRAEWAEVTPVPEWAETPTVRRDLETSVNQLLVIASERRTHA